MPAVPDAFSSVESVYFLLRNSLIRHEHQLPHDPAPMLDGHIPADAPNVVGQPPVARTPHTPVDDSRWSSRPVRGRSLVAECQCNFEGASHAAEMIGSCSPPYTAASS